MAFLFRRQSGFTIIELAIVIVLIGILGVTAGPKLLSKREFSAVATANQYIAHLRLVQLKALNHRGVCHNSVFHTISGDTFFGIPDNIDAACGTETAEDSRNILDSNTSIILIDEVHGNVTSPAFVFDSNGIASSGISCSGACLIQVSTSQSATYVCIHSQGYIRKVSTANACH